MRTATKAPTPNTDQAELWNGTSGQAWVDTQGLLDGLFEPFERRLADAVTAHGARRVLDIGCGTGSTTLAAAARMGSGGDCLGVDISQPMLAVARERARRARSTARFVCADAQTHPFERAGFDLILSRFGVMFFDDPVAAFANLRRAAADGAALCCFVWRSPLENPFMTEAERAAAPLIPALPAREPDAPGQFAFADRARVAAVLERSGWTDIDIAPVDVPCRFPSGALETYFTRLGPLARALQALDDSVRTAVIDVVRAAFERYVHDGEVRFDAACWRVGARAHTQRDAGPHA